MRSPRSSRQAQAFALALLALLLIAALVLVHRIGAPFAFQVHTPLFAESLGTGQPEPVSLPHRWRYACPDCETAWYQVPLSLDGPVDDRWAVYIESVAMNAAVYVNGELVGQGGRFHDPAARYWNRPLLIQLPGSALRAGDNLIYLLVKADPPGSGHLGRVAIGPAERLEAVADFRGLLKPVFALFVFVSTLILGLVMAVVWGYRRQREYGWFALATLASAGSQLDLFVVTIPVAAAWWTLGIGLASALSLAACTLFLRALLDLRLVLTSSLAWTLLALGLPVLLWFPAGVTTAWQAGLLLLVVALGWHLLMASMRHADARNAWLALPGSLLLFAGVRDLAHAFGIAGVGQGPFLPFTAPVLVGGFAWMLLGRFLSNLRAMELLNVDLRNAVQQKSRELEAQFQRVQTLERHAVLVAERERLMRDMHDGIGGQLVSTLAMLERGVNDPQLLSNVLRQSLDDLRLMIDSLDPVEDDLNAVLAMLRDRMAPHLESAGIELDWQVGVLPPLPGLGPSRVLQILRVLQEAISNALRHAGASHITISAGSGADGDGAARVRIEVRDNGRGFEPATVAARGRGLTNLRRRAAELGAELEIRSTPGEGSTVRLELPAIFAEPQLQR